MGKLSRLETKLQIDLKNNSSGEWWKNEKWNFGTKCKGWTIFQIFKIEPEYLRWVVENFQLTLIPVNTRKAIYKAVEILDSRNEVMNNNISQNTIIESKELKYKQERGVV